MGLIPRPGPDPEAAKIPGPIVLVGLSGSGKTAAGRLLARRLGWRFLDLDEEIEALASVSIPEIFAERGEEGFRALEARVTREARASRETVVSTGGGWMERPELRDSWPGCVRIWLRVEPGAAAARLANRPFSRPLLAGPDPESTLAKLLRRRRPAYMLAEHAVRTDGLDPEAVVDAILGAIEAPGERAGGEQP